MKKITILIFMLYTLVFMFLNIFSNSKNFSEIENRGLQTFPDFNFTSVLSGSFSSDLEVYASDQFVFRNTFVKLKARLSLLSGQVHNNDVYYGRDNYLLQRFTTTNKRLIQNIDDGLNNLFKDKEIKFHLMLVPTSVAINKDNLPRVSYDLDQRNILDNFSRQYSNQYIDVYNEFISDSDNDLYFKTDHHWNINGAYSAYKLMMQEEALAVDEFTINEISSNFQGSLFARSGYFWLKPESINSYLSESMNNVVVVSDGLKTTTLFNDQALTTRDQYNYFMGGNHALVQINTLHDEKPTLLVFKDSFANILIPLLSSHYSNIIVVDLRFTNNTATNLIDYYNPDEVLILYNIDNFLNDINNVKLR